jgi:hypothetical protein
MWDEIPSSPEAFRAKISVLLSETERSVSTIYLSYVRPFGEFTRSFSDLLFPRDSLRSQPANAFKVRLFLYQLMVQLEIFAESSLDDPLFSDNYTAALELAQSVCPFAVAISERLLLSFFSDLRTVHGGRWPLTIAQIEFDLGMNSTDTPFEVPAQPIHRTHFREALPAPPTQPDRTLLPRGPFPGRFAQLDKTIRVRIKKPGRGPQPESVRPLLSKKPQ